MKLLVITQKVDINDPILGFFHRWIEKFAEQCGQVTVICLEQGNFELPKNVKVLSLGKEKGTSRLKYLYNFYRFVWRERKNYDSVLVHMTPIYVMLGWLLWRVLEKKIALWYIHPKSDLKLTVAHQLVDFVASASPRSFPFVSKKLIVTGHGIDVSLFRHTVTGKSVAPSILFVGRLATVKNVDVLVEAALSLDSKGVNFQLQLRGGQDTNDPEYYSIVRNKLSSLEQKRKVFFAEPCPNHEMVRVYNQSDVLVNLTTRGSFDKVILEAMACETLVLVSNSAFSGVLPEELLFRERDAQDLEKKLENIMSMSATQKEECGKKLRQYVALHHSLENVVSKIITAFHV